MEFWAKSQGKSITDKDISRRTDNVRRLKELLGNELEPDEWKAVESEFNDLISQNVEEPVTLKKHLDDVTKCAEDFFDIYGEYFTEKEKKLTVEACRIHDIGKLNKVFQVKIGNGSLSGKTEDIPHGFLSAISVSKKEFLSRFPECDMSDFKAFITAVYYHHTRKDIWTDEQIKEYCEKYYIDFLRKYRNDENVKVYPSYRNKLLFGPGRYGIAESDWEKYALIKGLLNKFDYSVSAGYVESERNSDLADRRLKGNIYDALCGKGLRPVQKFMSDNCDNNVVAEAPTGSGKTEAALLWINGEKAYYTLPLQISSNAIYDRIKKQYGYDDVSLLHADCMQKFIIDGSKENAYIKYERARLLSEPLTICTVDQLFKFVYKALGTEIFAATLKYSKVVLDEIQSYSPGLIAALIYGLKMITDMGGRFAIITATLPPVIKYFMARYGLIEGEKYVYKDFSGTNTDKRHMVDMYNGPINTSAVIDDARNKKVLIICNTIKSAQNIYAELKEKCGNIHMLHSHYTKEDRRMIEESLTAFSDDVDAVGIWITTQIVEASMDIDFDVLYTEMSTADSLLQRMGRCNRRYRYTPETPNIHVYCTGNHTVYDKEIYQRSIDKLQTYLGDFFIEADKKKYIDEVYCVDELRETDYFKKIEKKLSFFDNLNPLDYSKEQADEKFRDIQNISIIPENVYNDNKELLDNCFDMLGDRYTGRETKSILREKIRNKTMSVNKWRGGILPDFVDKSAIGNETLDIHRAICKYDFDKEGCTGLGLFIEKTDDGIFW